MTETPNQQQTPQYPPPGYYYPIPQANEIELRELILTVWQSKWLILICALIFGSIGGIYTLFQPSIYESSALISPADNGQASQIAGLASQFGGLASLAGIDIGNQGSDKTTLALQVLQSRQFISEFIKTHHIKPMIMATKGWNEKTNTFKYDKDIYNPKTKKWLNTEGKTLEPSIIKSAKYFLKNILTVEQDSKTNMVTVKVDFYSPMIAKDWVTQLIHNLNEEIRQQDMNEAQNNT